MSSNNKPQPKDEEEEDEEEEHKFNIETFTAQIARSFYIPKEDIQLIADIMLALENKSITLKKFKKYISQKCLNDELKVKATIEYYKSHPVEAVRMYALKLLKTS